eukprot:64095_1
MPRLKHKSKRFKPNNNHRNTHSIRAQLVDKILTVKVLNRIHQVTFEQKYSQNDVPKIKLDKLLHSLKNAINKKQIKIEECNEMVIVKLYPFKCPFLELPPKGLNKLQIYQIKTNYKKRLTAKTYEQYRSFIQKKQHQMKTIDDIIKSC